MKLSSHRLIQSDVSLVTICFSLCFLLRHLSHVCIVETLFVILDSIFSPQTDLGRQCTTTVVDAPLSRAVVYLTFAFTIRFFFLVKDVSSQTQHLRCEQVLLPVSAPIKFKSRFQCSSVSNWDDYNCVSVNSLQI